ncbi:hypothetical protein Gogos_015372, partial [Gossypium gossypioides]|nr:hypothetical protein [Gossypium gossypioides]
MKTLPTTFTLSLVSRLNVYKTPPSSPTFYFCHSRFFPIPPPRPLSIMASATQPSSSQAVSPEDVNKETNIFQLIQAHQEKAARLSPVEEIRTVLDQSTRGMLSTFSQKHEGYPSASMVDFACDANGSLILAVSSLAVHTKDLLANFKCSLLVARDPEDRTDLVITLHGDAIAVSEKDQAAIRTAYLAKHPNAFWIENSAYVPILKVDFADFQFMRIEPKVVRYVSGVATALLGSGEFSREEYQDSKVDPIAQFSKPVASHMNKDHAEDTKVIVQFATSIPVIKNITFWTLSYIKWKILSILYWRGKSASSCWLSWKIIGHASIANPRPPKI